jgi:hypothetical protein
MLPYLINALSLQGDTLTPSIVLFAKGQKGFQVKFLCHSRVRTQLREAQLVALDHQTLHSSHSTVKPIAWPFAMF